MKIYYFTFEGKRFTVTRDDIIEISLSGTPQFGDNGSPTKNEIIITKKEYNELESISFGYSKCSRSFFVKKEDFEKIVRKIEKDVGKTIVYKDGSISIGPIDYNKEHYIINIIRTNKKEFTEQKIVLRKSTLKHLKEVLNKLEV